MPELTVTEDTYRRLQRLARPFVDTPESVIARLLSLAENQPVPDTDEDNAVEDQTMLGADAERGTAMEPTNWCHVNPRKLNKNWRERIRCRSSRL